jgi:hypothetical protein
MPAADIDVTGPNHLAIRIDAHHIAATNSRSRSVSHWLPDGRLARNEARATVSPAINRFCEVGGDGSEPHWRKGDVLDGRASLRAG